MIVQTLEGRRAFIRDNTRFQPTPHAPETVASPGRRDHADLEADRGGAGRDRPAAPLLGPSPGRAARPLARYILDNPETVAGKRVIDFATGSGIVAIAAMKGRRGQRAGRRYRRLLRGGRRPETPRPTASRWAFTDVNLLDAPPLACDVLLAGDICYEKADGRGGDGLAAAKAGAAGAAVFIGDPGRTYFPQGRPGEAGRVPGRDHPRARGFRREAHERLDSALAAN